MLRNVKQHLLNCQPQFEVMLNSEHWTVNNLKSSEMFHLRKLSHLSVHSSTSQKALLTIGKGLCIPDISASVNTTSGDSIDVIFTLLHIEICIKKETNSYSISDQSRNQKEKDESGPPCGTS